MSLTKSLSNRVWCLGETKLNFNRHWKAEKLISKYRNFKDYHIEQLRDPEDAKIYLSVALEDYEQNGDIEAFLLAVRDVILTLYGEGA